MPPASPRRVLPPIGLPAHVDWRHVYGQGRFADKWQVPKAIRGHEPTFSVLISFDGVIQE